MPTAESADEPGSRDGILEITSRKGGKLQRPVKPEKQGADVSRKTGSHDGPERGWPREPRGSLEGSCAVLFEKVFGAGVFKGTSSRGPGEHLHSEASRVIPAANTNSKARSVVTRTLASTGRAFQLQQAFEPATYLPPTAHLHSRYPVATQLEALSKPLVVCSTFYLNLDRRCSPDRRLRKIFPPAAHVPPYGDLFLVRGAAAPFSPACRRWTSHGRPFPAVFTLLGRGAFSFWSTP